jgi:ANTAR domain
MKERGAVSRTFSNGRSLNVADGREPDDDGMRRSREEEPTPSVQEAVVCAAFALLQPEQLAEVAAKRGIVEQATGMLMLIYELDADNAIEVLKWGSRARDVKIHVLATQFVDSLVGRKGSQRLVDLRSACDDVLFAAAEGAGLGP